MTTLYYQKTHDQCILHKFVYLTEDKWTTVTLSTIDEMTSSRDSLTSTNSLNPGVNTLIFALFAVIKTLRILKLAI